MKNFGRQKKRKTNARFKAFGGTVSELDLNRTTLTYNLSRFEENSATLTEDEVDNDKNPKTAQNADANNRKSLL